MPRILIVDDREENRYVLCRSLEGAGFKCQQALRGIDALEIAQELPDLIILDVHLPDMSGYEICHRIKSDPRTASIAILQISASFVSSDDRVRALESGADGYLTHPIDRLVLIATVRSLLRLREAERVSRGSAAHWQSTFDALGEGLAVVDSENRLVRWNSAFGEICSGTELNSGDDVGRLLQKVTDSEASFLLPGQDRLREEVTIDRKTIQLSMSPIEVRETGGERILVLTDITDRKLAEYAVRTAEKLAATGKLANAIAHEINNPLEALINLIYLAGSSSSVEEIHRLLAGADTELARIARITRQALAFHRDSQIPVAVDIGDLIAGIVDLFEKMATSRKVRLAYDRQDVPMIYAYPGQLSQVFGNILRNAVEAAPPHTTVALRVRPIRRGEREGVRITVHDCGRGIPRDVQRSMFDPFFTTKALKGSGLGLWVSKSLILRHEGTIRFRSSERVGACGTIFEVFLPIAGAHAPEVLEEQE